MDGQGRRREAKTGRRALAVVTAVVAALVLVAGACSSKGGGGASSSTPGAEKASTSTTAPPPVSPGFQLLARDGAANDYFGGALEYNTFKTPIVGAYYATPGEAALSSDGSVALVGAPGHANGPNTGAGAVYVYKRSGTTWVQAAQLVAPDQAKYDAFGWSVALSGDGNSAIVGAPLHDVGRNADAGAAYIFRARGSQWTVAAVLHAPDAAAYDGFGWSVGFSRDGSTVIVGATSHNVANIVHVGVAYVFRTNGSLWTPVHELAPGNPELEASFGSYVALSANGSVAAVTKSTHVDGSNQLRRGALYIFRSSDAWKTANQVAVFDDTNHNADGSTDAFGVQVVLSDNGRVAAVAAPDVNVGKAVGAGAVFIYTTSNDWTKRTANREFMLRDQRPVQFGYYGSSVALSADGTVMFTGVDGGGANDQGSGDVVRPVPGTAGAPPDYTPRSLRHIVFPAPSLQRGRFGTADAISADGKTLLGTSPWLTVGRNTNQGAAYALTVTLS